MQQDSRPNALPGYRSRTSACWSRNGLCAGRRPDTTCMRTITCVPLTDGNAPAGKSQWTRDVQSGRGLVRPAAGVSKCHQSNEQISIRRDRADPPGAAS